MTSVRYTIRAGAYYDSVVLMQLQRGLLALPDVVDVGVVMATQANRELLAANSLLPADISAKPDDLLIVIKAVSDQAAADALGQVDGLLTRRRASEASDYHPHSLEAALRQLPDAAWVLISVPGRYAAAVARQALDLHRHVFLYSDNVSLENEIALKRFAAERGLLVMGPDCGTAILNGIGFGFANRVRRGGIGLVGASGTGTQAISTRIHELGAGISHAIGTGSRDLNSKVGAVTTLQGLELLGRDPDTQVIVLVSKPPDPEMVARVLACARRIAKPVVLDLIGYPPPARKLGNLHFAVSMSEAAEIAADQMSSLDPKSSKSNTLSTVIDKSRSNMLAKRQGYLRGLFSGGTLAYETLLGLQPFITPLFSNLALSDTQKLADPLHSQANMVLDLGDEFFMVGRLHPMIDNDLRIRRLKQEAADPQVGWILLDVVLGEGSHPDPGQELAPVIQEITQESNIEVVVVLIGTDADPQNSQYQIEKFEAAGASVVRSVTEMLDHLASRLGSSPSHDLPPVQLEPFNQPMRAINIGLESFYSSMLAQGAQAVQVDWRPPAGGDERLAGLLQRMKA